MNRFKETEILQPFKDYPTGTSEAIDIWSGTQPEGRWFESNPRYQSC